MTSQELRQKYIEFFSAKGGPASGGKNHAEIPSASLVPENDPSILFTTAGMSPLVPFLLGEKHPSGKRLVNSQKCVRTGDIDDVGDKTHHTFFEMLGHWSLGDPASPDGIGQGGYFKKQAIEMSYEFLTESLGLDKNRLAFTVFEGDENALRDEEAASVWKKLGVSEKRIAYLPKKDNWWEPTGAGGPCGPCTEMFYWSDNENPAPEVFDPYDKHWVEIGNDVLMQYEKVGAGLDLPTNYAPAKQKNIDNGTGLERLLAVINGLDDNYQTDLFWPIIEKIEELSGKKYLLTTPIKKSKDFLMPVQSATGRFELEKEGTKRSMRIIADHLRAATFIMGDDFGLAPSNVDQGYVVRKLIRRAIRHGRMIGIKENFTHKITEVVIKIMSEIYPELVRNKKFVIDNMQAEEEKFTKTLQEGLNKFKRLIDFKYIPISLFPKVEFGDETPSLPKRNIKIEKISGEDAFDLFQSYGFPLELTKELAKEKGLKVDEAGFNEEFKKHQELSRTAAAGKFKGGLSDHSEKVTQYHTATHLLNAALRQVLGDNVFQKGSNITEERLRFDFSHSEKMTAEQIKKVEDLVNEQIQKNLSVSFEDMSVEQAKIKGAIGVFENKYGDKVKVYTIGGPSAGSGHAFSMEICGGPHVKNTSELGHFKIIKEEASSAGVRRIKAVLE